MFYFDPLWLLFSLPALVLMLWAQARTRRAYAKYAEVRNLLGVPGWEVARRILDGNGLWDVDVQEVPGELSDHYTELRVGPHVGVGVELLIGDRVSVLVDGRSVLYTMVDRSVADQTFKNDLSLTGGLNFYF